MIFSNIFFYNNQVLDIIVKVGVMFVCYEQICEKICYNVIFLWCIVIRLSLL